jgi:XTP/dITP diphosphohydrolase
VRLLLASSNAGKLVEVREILAGLPFEMVSLAEVGLAAPEETGDTFHDNAALKARACATVARTWALGDDSGICVDALDGGPGVHSARYAETEEARRAKLLGVLRGVPEARRGAHFFCAVALSAPDGERLWRAEGRVDGHIAQAARGTNGFGYDPLFLPLEAPGRTLAELGAAEKNALSHRGRALARLRPVLEELGSRGDLR